MLFDPTARPTCDSAIALRTPRADLHPYRQIRQGIAANTKGTAFVVYEDVMDAKGACDKLNGFNFQNRYLVVLYHQPEKSTLVAHKQTIWLREGADFSFIVAKSQQDLAERQQNLEKLKREHGID
jgi:RNA recognition motif-containing protein